jgi:hypothetical protein
LCDLKVEPSNLGHRVDRNASRLPERPQCHPRDEDAAGLRPVAVRGAEWLEQRGLGRLAPSCGAAGARWGVATLVPAAARAVAVMQCRHGISAGHSVAVEGSGRRATCRHPRRSPTRRRELTYDPAHADDAHSRDGPR